MVRREMLDSFHGRIKQKPWHVSWEYPEELGGGHGKLSDTGDIDYEGLNDHEKVCLYVYAWNLGETNPFRRTVMKNFEWTLYKTKKIVSELIKAGYIESQAVFSEDTGLLAGRGYWYNTKKAP